MCVLAGWFCAPGAEPPADVLCRMLDLMSHRGPDDRGDYRDTGHCLALGHLRLSIIDLTTASHQPMRDGDSGVTLAYNGEVYNFRSLRAELQALGHHFHSQGDTEVVLRGFLQWGTGCFARFAGMFALALWDPRSGTLHLARDAMGMKPLYFAETRGGVVFASEVKAFKALPGFRLQPCDAGLRQYLEFGYVFDTHQTIFEGIRKLPPGCRAEITRGAPIQTERHFVPPAPRHQDPRDEGQRLDELTAVLGEVVEEHLIADVPLGLLLSGGLDSSLIAALAAKKSSILTIRIRLAVCRFIKRIP